MAEAQAAREKRDKAAAAEKTKLMEGQQRLTAARDEKSAIEEELGRVERAAAEAPPVLLTSRDTVYEVVEEGTIAPAVEEKVEELDPAQRKAQRLARVIVSDIILYNKEILNTAANQRNFYEILDNQIKRSEDYFREKVSSELIARRDFLREELEKLRISLKA